MSKQRRVRDKDALAKLVIPAAGPTRGRRSGAGAHSSTPNRQRTRQAARRAAIRISES